jgi:hypothetical protein
MNWIFDARAGGVWRMMSLALTLLSAPSQVFSQEVLSQEIFRSEDANGLVSFSDVASEGAAVMHLALTPMASDALENQQRMIDQQLAVAKALEESRLARHEARTKRLQALAAVQPRAVYYRQEDRYLGGYSSYNPRWGFRPGWGKPGYPGVRPPHPGLPIRPPQVPPSRRVPLPPLK